MSLKVLVCLLFVYFFISCKSNIKKDILPEEKMQAVMWELIKADVYTNDYLQNDSLINAPEKNAELQQKIFVEQKISKSQFEKSYDYYIAHPAMMKNIFDTILNRNSREKRRRLDTFKTINNEQSSE